MDPLSGLAARYCIRQDAHGFIELWALLVALAAATVAISISLRRGITERMRRRAALLSALLLTCLIPLSCAFAFTIFRWCYESAAPSLGLVLDNAAGKSLDTMVCLSPHAVEMINGWILIAVSCVGAIVLLNAGIVQIHSALRRVLSFAGAAAFALFAVANGGLMLFSISWCRSSRLF